MKTVIKIGRDKSNDIQINEPRISRNHAIITHLGDGKFDIRDLGSTNGTFVNGERITQRIITSVDKVHASSCLVNWVQAFYEPDGTLSTIIQEEPYSKILKTISVGSSEDNDIVLSAEVVSEHHATISSLQHGDFFIEDLDSSNGTFVNGARIQSKNFLRTDLLKIATVDLPQNWFRHEKLKNSVFKDHIRSWIVLFSMLVLIPLSILGYVNRCAWLNCGCTLSADEIYSKNKNSLVHIVHHYYYTIKFNGITYYIGKNQLFNVYEANTSKDNLLPFNSVSGSGCIIKENGTILTSALIVNPWLNAVERNSMIREIIDSKTINNFSADQDFDICGESADLKWIGEGQVNNIQNYISATAITACTLAESSNILQSVKQSLPESSAIIYGVIDSSSVEEMNRSALYYYSVANPRYPTSSLRDTFFTAVDSFNLLARDYYPINKMLPTLPEGGIVLNERGELVGIIQQQKILFVHRFNNLIK